MRRSKLAVIAMLSTLVAGCNSVQGDPRASEIDVRILDVGAYSARPPTVEDPRSEKQGIIMEALHIGDLVADPYEVDPALKVGWGTTTITDPTVAIRLLADVARPVLVKYGMIAGFSVGAGDAVQPPRDSKDARPASLTITVLRFPDSDSATKAAKEIDAADFAQNPANVAVPIPSHPEANSHWRPTVPSISATAAHGPYVMNIYAFVRELDQQALAEVIKKTIEVQAPILDSTEPTSRDKLSSLPTDPGSLLIRTLASKPEPITVDGGTTATFTGRGYVHSGSKRDERSKIAGDAGIMRAAYTASAYIVETKDEQGAEALVQYYTSADNTHPVDDPPGVPTTRCIDADKPAADKPHIYCYVRYRNYVATVNGMELANVHRQAGAQYAILANAAL
jgi:hypothetical protein